MKDPFDWLVTTLVVCAAILAWVATAAAIIGTIWLYQQVFG